MRVAFAALAAAALLAGCGSDSGTVAADASAPANADRGTLVDRFAPCPYGEFDSDDPRTVISGLDRWFEIAEIIDSPDPDGTRASLERTFTATEVGGARGETRIGTHPSYIPAISWAIENGHRAFIASIDDGFSWGFENAALYVIISTGDNRSFFAGDCGEQYLYTGLEDQVGEERVQAILDEIPGLTAEEVAATIGYERPEVQEVPAADLVILNPETVDNDFLSTLNFAAMVVSIDGEVRDDRTVCFESDEGWNDCFVPGIPVFEAGAVLDVYYGDDPTIRAYLLGPGADLTSPLQLIGEIKIPRDFEETAVRLEVTLDSNQSSIKITHTIDAADLSDGDPEVWWPAVGRTPEQSDPVDSEQD